VRVRVVRAEGHVDRARAQLDTQKTEPRIPEALLRTMELRLDNPEAIVASRVYRLIANEKACSTNWRTLCPRT